MGLLLVSLMVALAACGEDGSNNDTVLTGFSGVLIFGIVAYIIYRVVRSKTK